MDEQIFAVLTISDSCYNKKAEDTSGPCLVRLVKGHFEGCEVEEEIIPDEKIVIEQALCKYADTVGVAAVFTTGGTGFSPRDVTPEATRTVIQRECPQLVMAMALDSFKKTPFAALSRATAGIRNKTLIVNFPGSLKAVRECFDSIKTVLPHAIQLINDNLQLVKKVHQEVQQPSRHVCPHKTGSGDGNDRNSPYPMLPVRVALEVILQTIEAKQENKIFLKEFASPVNIPPFRASIKDGYAMNSKHLSGVKKVVAYISAGDEVSNYQLDEDECFKINTGAPLPSTADCVVQVEDTILRKTDKNGIESLVEILIEPSPMLDVREIGCDLQLGSKLFPSVDFSDVVTSSVLASVGRANPLEKPRIGIVSTGSELIAPTAPATDGKIYDSNTTMLEELLKYFGFECTKKLVISDDYDSVKNSISALFDIVDFVICTGGVSMGDKDYIKPVLKELKFDIHFGRVNMKPGKPMTFASNKNSKYFFGLPGNPVSAFVTFHLFALPALRFANGWPRNKCELANIQVTLQNDKIPLDQRPEYVRASIINRNGHLYASITGNQMSSRLQSIVGADVLLQLPGRTESKPDAIAGDTITASVLRYDFISKYE